MTANPKLIDFADFNPFPAISAASALRLTGSLIIIGRAHAADVIVASQLIALGRWEAGSGGAGGRRGAQTAAGDCRICVPWLSRCKHDFGTGLIRRTGNMERYLLLSRIHSVDLV
jgi:hypothetical protein